MYNVYIMVIYYINLHHYNTCVSWSCNILVSLHFCVNILLPLPIEQYSKYSPCFVPQQLIPRPVANFPGKRDGSLRRSPAVIDASLCFSMRFYIFIYICNIYIYFFLFSCGKVHENYTFNVGIRLARVGHLEKQSRSICRRGKKH